MCVDRTLKAASGWLELGLADEALFELQSIPGDSQGTRSVLEVKLAAQMAAEQWNPASDTARVLCLKASHEPEFYLHAALCLHETGDTYAAFHWLLRGPRSLQGIPIFHYNIACYLCTLGHDRRARVHLERAISMDEGLIEVARRDHSLSGIAL